MAHFSLSDFFLEQFQTTTYLGLSLLDLVAPPRCMNCLVEGSWLCQRCSERFPPFAQRCIGCEEKDLRGVTCDSCRQEVPLLGVISAGYYQMPSLRRGVHWLKFKGVRGVADTLASLLVPKLNLIAPVEQLQQEAVLVPMPLHVRRARERGFNQSYDIAQAIMKETDIPVWDGLTRSRSTHHQAKLPKELRAMNVEAAFALEKPIPKNVRFIILIDDVATTGATLSAAAQVMQKEWHGFLWAATIARG